MGFDASGWFWGILVLLDGFWVIWVLRWDIGDFRCFWFFGFPGVSCLGCFMGAVELCVLILCLLCLWAALGLGLASLFCWLDCLPA